MKKLDIAIVAVLAIIFVGAAVDKLFHFDGFLAALANYAIVPRGSAAVLAPVVVVAELMAGLGLMTRKGRAWALPACAALLIVFSGPLAANLVLGSRGICGCWFTFTLGEGDGLHIAQNLLLALLSVTVWRGSLSRVDDP